MDIQMPTIETVIEEVVRAAVLKVFGELATMPVPAAKADKACMTVKELAAQLGISQPRANDLTHIKDFPVICVGRRRLIPIDAFNAWLVKNQGKVV